ncbi:MAG: FAD-dependent oxidoreductase, partial [Sedimentisphaerales bacterium]
MAEIFDVAIIGSGPGGYYAAIRCAQKGATVAIIEKAETGGTCLNRGCVPSKALLASAEVLLQAKNAGDMGVDIAGISPNWVKMQQRKDAIVAGSRKGLSGLLQANKIKMFAGTAIISSPKVVVVKTQTGQIEIN